MTRDELVARMSSRELSAWMALLKVHGEEREYARHVAESGDGQVIISGRDEDDDEDEDGGEAEQ